MTEQNNSISIPVIPGMRDDLEPHTAPPGTITVARNVRFPTNGVVQSRRGQAALNVTTAADVPYTDVLNTSQGPDFLHPCANGFVFGSAGYAFRYDATTGATNAAGGYSTAQPRGKFEAITREELTPIDATTLTPWPLSCTVLSGLVAICHSVGNGQAATGAAVVGLQRDYVNPVATAGAVLRVMTESGAVASSDYYDEAQSAMVVNDHTTQMVMVFQNGTDVRVRLIDSLGTVSSSTSVGTLTTATSFYAAATLPGFGWVLVYQSAAGTLTIKKMTGSTASVTQTIAITAGAGAPVSVYADSTNVYVGWALRGGGAFNAQAEVFDLTLTVVSGGIVTLYNLGAANAYLGPPLFGPSVNTGRALALVAHQSQSRPDVAAVWTRSFELTAVGGALTTGVDNFSIVPLSAPFNNGMWWARHATRSPGGIQTQRSVLLDFQENRVTSSTSSTRLQYPKVLLIGETFTFPENTNVPGNCYKQHLHLPAQLSTGEWVMGIPRIVRQELKPAGGQGYLPLCEWLRFATGCEQQAKTCGNDVLVSGSLTSPLYGFGSYQYTNGTNGLARGSQGLDIGLLQMPGIASLTASNSTGTLANNGVYQYRAVIELIDAFGRRWRSAPSNVATVTLGAADDTVTLAIECWLPILRAFSEVPANSRINVHIYRSLNGQANFQRCTDAMGAPVPYTTGTVSWIDLLGDTELAQREYLYTDGGALQHDHPPSCRFIAVTEDRVWLAGLWDSRVAQSSKIIVPGEPIQFSDSEAFQVPIDSPITGIAAQDGTTILFAADSVWVVQGLGPNDQGQGAWETARCITRSTGCIDWRSIVETSVGVFYQSERGIMLLPRGAGEPQFIGMAVEELLESLGSVITGAAVCQTSDGNTVRFCTANGTLIFDLETSAWSDDLPPTSPASTVHTKVCDCAAGPTYARKALTAGVGFDQEQSALTTDNGTAIPSYVEWAPVHPAGRLAGWTVFTGAISAFGKLAGASYPDKTLTVACQVDADTSNSKTKTTMTDMGDLDYRRLQLGNLRQGSAATLSFAAAGAPWRFVGWTVELEPLPGTRNVRPNTEQY